MSFTMDDKVEGTIFRAWGERDFLGFWIRRGLRWTRGRVGLVENEDILLITPTPLCSFK